MWSWLRSFVMDRPEEEPVQGWVVTGHHWPVPVVTMTRQQVEDALGRITQEDVDRAQSSLRRQYDIQTD
jgi:hypothetical protein